MKRISKIICIIIATVMIAVVPVCGHSGRTDSSGGHRDNRNVSGLGYYHYHCGGYPPHLHSNGSCPYKSVGHTATASKVRKTYTVKPATVKNVRSSSTSALRTTVKWNKVKGASGYKVYRSSGNGYKCIKTIKSGSVARYTDKSVSAGKTYYYKIRAFKKVNGIYKYGSYSSSKKVKIKKNSLDFDFNWTQDEKNMNVGLDFQRLWYNNGELCAEIAIKNCTDSIVVIKGIDSIKMYCNDSSIGTGSYYRFDSSETLQPGERSGIYKLVFDSSRKIDLVRKGKTDAYFNCKSDIAYEIQ